MNRPAPPGGALRVQLAQHAPMPLHGGFACEPGELLALVGLPELAEDVASPIP